MASSIRLILALVNLPKVNLLRRLKRDDLYSSYFGASFFGTPFSEGKKAIVLKCFFVFLRKKRDIKRASQAGFPQKPVNLWFTTTLSSISFKIRRDSDNPGISREGVSFLR